VQGPEQSSDQGEDRRPMTDQPIGATPQDWQHFDLVLGLGRDLLPVVCDPNAKPSQSSGVRQFGKIPSWYSPQGGASGIRTWSARIITAAERARWAADSRLGMCVRTRAVRAIDVDVDDEELAHAIDMTILERVSLPVRTRANSHKFLLAFRLEGDYRKRVIKTARGAIEFLADGQQFIVAGTHPSGMRYEWLPHLPTEIPTITPEQFESLWATLQAQFGVHAPQDSTEREHAPKTNGADHTLLTTIDDATLTDLKSALAWPPLLEAAASNSVWSEIGMALLSLGAQGRELWLEFSRNAPKYTPGSPETWWELHQ
jgi:hypothetical protein